MAQEPGSEKCVCVAERRPLRVLRLQKRETCTFEFVLVWVYFERKGFESGFRDQTLRCKVLRFKAPSNAVTLKVSYADRFGKHLFGVLETDRRPENLVKP